ncbi:MAG TPA: porin [Candidatus Polarisedimenticolia bacterium]|nr:porin [Candidatus Polarisedimenticolia bacterium]
MTRKYTRRPRLLDRLPAFAILLAVAFSIPAPALAWNTLVEGEKGKLEIEFRLQAWAMTAGPDTPFIPGLNSAPPVAQDENINDFFVRRARVLLKAQISQSLELAIQFGQDNLGSKILRDDASMRIKDAAINWKKNDALQVIVGQFKVPFLRQNLASGFNQMLVDRSLVDALRPAIEGSRDQGGQVWGNHGGLQYRAALFDGSDQEDTNAGSSVRQSARLSYNWFTPEPTFGSTDTTLGQKKILQIAGQADHQNGRVDARDDVGFAAETRSYTAWAAEIYYDQPFGEKWAVTALAVWLQRRDDYDTVGLETRSTDGHYGQAGLLLPWEIGPGRLQIAGRWEEIESDRGAGESSMRARTFGLTWFTKGHDRKIQFDHGELKERPTDLDDNFYRLSVVAVF